jgi:hypothetical protein
MFLVLPLASIPGCDTDTPHTPPAIADPNAPLDPSEDNHVGEAIQPLCEIHLELPATMTAETRDRSRVQIRNVGTIPVTLVMPGDGSSCRWRTPIVGWSVLPVDSTDQHPEEPPRRRVVRCGNINRLNPGDVFVLNPGEEKELNEWLDFPSRLSPGKYRVVFYYINVPDLKWSGIPLGNHDEEAMNRLKKSTPVALVSNEVQFVMTQ